MSQYGLKVLMLVDVATFHGERITEQLRKQGIDLTVASLEDGSVEYERLRRVGPVRAFHYVLAASQVSEMVRSFRPDVVYAHYASGYGFTAALAVSRQEPPLMMNLWGSDILMAARKTRFHRWKTRRALKRADYVLADSHYLLEAAGKLTGLKDSEVLSWGIEREYLELHKKSYALNRPLRIIVPRAHEAVYNNLFVLTSLAPLINDGIVEVTFPDFGSLAGSFKTTADRLTSGGVRFYARKERGEFLRYMAEHDLYLSAARSDSSPVSLIEAMALGLVPACADIAGVREWLNTDSGFTFAQDDAGQLQALIRRIHDGGETFDKMRRGNQERVREEAIFEDNVAHQISIMRRLCGRD